MTEAEDSCARAAREWLEDECVESLAGLLREREAVARFEEREACAQIVAGSNPFFTHARIADLLAAIRSRAAQEKP